MRPSDSPEGILHQSPEYRTDYSRADDKLNWIFLLFPLIEMSDLLLIVLQEVYFRNMMVCVCVNRDRHVNNIIKVHAKIVLHLN